MRTFTERFICLVLLGIPWSGCHLPKGITTPQTPEVSDGGVLPSDPSADDCQAAEDRIRALQCTRRDGSNRWETPKGAKFADFCRWVEADGRTQRPDCIRLITTCADLDAAQQVPFGKKCQ